MTSALRQVLHHGLRIRRWRAIDHDWAARHKLVYLNNPLYATPCSSDVERAHLDLWKPIGRRPKMDTLRICANISGRLDIRIVPEELFACEVEDALRPATWAATVAHKSLYGRFFPQQLFPRSFLHRINGEYYDSGLTIVPTDEAARLARGLPYPVIVKPNWGSSGGVGVSIAATEKDLLGELAVRSDCVVQEYLYQHPYFQQFNSSGINSVRLYTYRSPQSGRVHILNHALRMGKGGSLDNETAGGIVCYFADGGRLNMYAVDKYGRKYMDHPDTNICFADATPVPSLGNLYEIAIALSNTIPIRLAGWDFCMDLEGRWRCLEVNVQGNTIRFSQYAGIPFFGDLTEEVIECCRLRGSPPLTWTRSD